VNERNGEVRVESGFEVIERAEAYRIGCAIFIFAGKEEAVGVIAEGGFVEIE